MDARVHGRALIAAALVAAAMAATAPSRPAAAWQESAAMHVAVAARAVGVDTAGPGGRFRLEVDFDIEDGWHFYGPGDFHGQGTTLRTTAGAEGLTVGPFRPTREPTPHKYDWDDGPRMEFKGRVTYVADVSVAADAKPGPRTITGEAEVYVCNEEGCLPPEALPFSVAIDLPATPAPPTTPGGAGGPPGVPAAPPDTSASGVPAAGEGDDAGITFAFLLAAVGAGFLTILTPCVFPMLPLTVSLLTKHAQREPTRVARNAAVYGAGMFFSLAGVGLLLSVVLDVAPTTLALSPGFNLAVAAFLGVLALSLFGAFDLQLPAFLTDWAQSRASAGGGAAGLFFMGMTLAFTSFSCAAPFAGTLLVAAQADLLRGIVGMSVYAATFAAPFVGLALFPGFLARLPRSGGWLNAIKVVMGFVEVAAALKFLRAADMNLEWGVFTYEFVLAAWVACAFGAAVYLLGFITLPHDTRAESIGVGRLLAALLFLASGLFLLPGTFGRPLPSFIEGFILRDPSGPERGGTSTGSAAPADDLDWKRFQDDLDGAMAEARATGRPVFIDFTGVG